MRDRDHHVFALDQVLVLDLVFMLDDDGLARCRKFRLHRCKFVLDDRLNAGARAQDVEVIGDFQRQLVEFLGYFLAASAVRRARRNSRMALACSSDSRAVPSSASR